MRAVSFWAPFSSHLSQPSSETRGDNPSERLRGMRRTEHMVHLRRGKRRSFRPHVAMMLLVGGDWKSLVFTEVQWWMNSEFRVVDSDVGGDWNMTFIFLYWK